MSKRSPGSKHQMKIGKERYKKEREAYRLKLARKLAANTNVLDVLGEET